MKLTDLTLCEQMRITEREIEERLRLLDFTPEDSRILVACKPLVAGAVDDIVKSFYHEQTSIEPVARLIGDAESLARLRRYMRKYILELFDGRYNEEYAQSRLRIGLVHNRIGVSPKLYLAAVRKLQSKLSEHLQARNDRDCVACNTRLQALEKIMLFDLTLVFDTYIQSLLNEVERGRLEMEQYAAGLEEKVNERTSQLRELARKDGLTGLLNQRSFYEELRREISRAQRRGHELALLYIDLDGFKALNDTLGHQRGDELLIAAADTLRAALRSDDTPARYGGDEFCVILPETHEARAQDIGKRLLKIFDEKKDDAPVTMSIGVAGTGPEVFTDAATLVKQADGAMYRAKKQPGNALCVADYSSGDEKAGA